MVNQVVRFIRVAYVIRKILHMRILSLPCQTIEVHEKKNQMYEAYKYDLKPLWKCYEL